jgi:hypothetical protein
VPFQNWIYRIAGLEGGGTAGVESAAVRPGFGVRRIARQAPRDAAGGGIAYNRKGVDQ